jgi:hypothetical protein
VHQVDHVASDRARAAARHTVSREDGGRLFPHPRAFESLGLIHDDLAPRNRVLLWVLVMPQQ